jgi:phosphatidylglycerol:prolipoprotein diacylglycerol transferase
VHPLLTVVEWHGVARPIGSYGALLALAFVCGSALSVRTAELRGLDVGAVISALAGAIGAGCAGAYLCSVIVLWPQLGSLRAAIAQPGIVFYGGLVAGGLAFTGLARSSGLPALTALDCALPGLPVAHALGRLGCWFGGCCYGAISDLPWAVAYPDGHPAALPRHPWPLYEASALLLLAAVFWPQARFASWPGRRAAGYLVSYAALRLALEPLRGDPERGVFLHGGCSVSQVVSLLLLMAALAFLARPRPLQAWARADR